MAITDGVVNSFAGAIIDMWPARSGIGSTGSLDSINGLGQYGDNIYSVSRGSSYFRKINKRTGVISTLAGAMTRASFEMYGVRGGTVNGQSLSIYALATGAEGVFFHEGMRGTVSRLNDDRTGTSVLSGQLGVADYSDGLSSARHGFSRSMVLFEGNLYIAELDHHVVRRVNIASGDVKTIAGQPGVIGNADGAGDTASFSSPRAVAVSGEWLYVAEQGSNLIRRVRIIGDASFLVETFAGNGAPGFVDGPARSASFNDIRGLWVHSGALYAAEYANNSIRKIELSTGVVSTMVGFVGHKSRFVGGIGNNASVNKPNSMTSDGYNLYVQQDDGGVARVNLRTAEVSFFLGSPGYSRQTLGDQSIDDPAPRFSGIAWDERFGLLLTTAAAVYVLE